MLDQHAPPVDVNAGDATTNEAELAALDRGRARRYSVPSRPALSLSALRRALRRGGDDGRAAPAAVGRVDAACAADPRDPGRRTSWPRLCAPRPEGDDPHDLGAALHDPVRHLRRDLGRRRVHVVRAPFLPGPGLSGAGLPRHHGHRIHRPLRLSPGLSRPCRALAGAAGHPPADGGRTLRHAVERAGAVLRRRALHLLRQLHRAARRGHPSALGECRAGHQPVAREEGGRTRPRRGRGLDPRQIGLHRQYQPRNPHAAECACSAWPSFWSAANSTAPSAAM